MAKFFDKKFKFKRDSPSAVEEQDENSSLGDSGKEYQYQSLNNNPEGVSIDSYHEHLVTSVDYAQNYSSKPLQRVGNYLRSLFPIANWILFYNRQWATGDIIAGITVGVVLVPQSMGYATIANLSPEYGLYSSFIGVFLYCLFATSKDVSIGPVAVMSMQVGKVVNKVWDVYPDASGPMIATFLSLICGSIALGLGLLRLGFILEFIPAPAVYAFMTGSALNIASGQVPLLMGYNKKVNTRTSTYLVIIETLKHLPDTKVDLAFGLVGLFILYAWKYTCDWGMKRFPRYRKIFFYLQALRHSVVIIIETVISWAITHPYQKKHPGKTIISLNGSVPSGLQHEGVMTIPPKSIMKVIAPEIPVSVIVLLLEHISISKSFGRLNDYTVVPDQELIAIGVANLIGTFFSAYPATGSFSRSALKAKSGVRTPLAGIYTGGAVLLALYCFTDAFYYIPKAGLAAIVIHCVSDLVASWRVTWSLFKTSPLDCLIFVVAVFVSVFATIEDGIYFSVCASAAVLLWRIAKPNGVFLGKVSVAQVVNPRIVKSSDGVSQEGDTSTDVSYEEEEFDETNEYKKQSTTIRRSQSERRTEQQQIPSEIQFYTRWVPLPSKSNRIHTTMINNDVHIHSPPPGVIVFRPSEAFTYPNSGVQLDRVLEEVKKTTKSHQDKFYKSVGDRPWNDPGPFDPKTLPLIVGLKALVKLDTYKNFFHHLRHFDFNWKFWLENDDVKGDDEDSDLEITASGEKVNVKPTLRLVHFDFSSVTAMDYTSITLLIDLHKLIYRYSGVDVEFHFSGIISPWIRRSLLANGFGRPSSDGKIRDIEEAIGGDEKSKSYADVVWDGEKGLVAALDTDTPFFHLEIPDYQ